MDFNVSFSGCGFLGLYHVGVASAIKEYAPDLIVNKVSGASAGAIAACGLITGICLGQATSDVLKIVIQARQRALGALHPSFNLMKILRQGLRKNLPNDSHLVANGRLHVSLTRFSDGQNVVVNQFDNKEELIQALLCSAFIPFYCGTVPPMFKGVRYIDGGWSDNLLRLNENTITVSPFSGESDICPMDFDSQSYLSFDIKNTNVRFTSQNLYRLSVALFPPHPEILSEMCREGFEDALKFLAQHNLITCARCVAVRSSIWLDSHKNDLVEVEVEEEIEEQHPLPKPHVHRPRKPRERYSSVNNPRYVSEMKLEDSESDCETCRNTVTYATKKGLPQVVRDTLADAEAGERNLLSYVLDIRPIKWLRYMTIPWLLPVDLAVAACTKFLDWLPSLPEDSVWFVNSASEALRFILKEIDLQRAKTSSRLTCQLAITDLSFISLPTEIFSMGTASTTQPDNRISRRVSMVDTPSNSRGECTVTELNFGFSVDLESNSNGVRQMNNIVSKDTVKTSVFPASEVACAAQNLEMEGLRRATSIGGLSSPETDMGQQENFDAYESMLNYTRQRDAIMSYYYLDEHNQVKVTKIFGLQPKGSNEFPAVSTPAGIRSASGRRHSVYCMESVPEKDCADSGVSCAGEESVGQSKRKKDSQQESNRNLSPGMLNLERSHSFSKYRSKHHQKPRAQSHSRKLPFFPSSGTASESDTEQLFVPERRRRKSSNEDAYEAEDSSE